MKQKDVQEAARLAAIEYVLINTLSMFYRANRMDRAQIDALHAAGLALLQKETFPGADAAQGDLLSSEVEYAVRELLDAAADKAAGPTSPTPPQG